MSRPRVISTHFFRRTARATKRELERWQEIANGDEAPLGYQGEAQRKLGVLELRVDSELKVKRCASARRGRWEVISLG